jgi:hypothetical protein
MVEECLFIARRDPLSMESLMSALIAASSYTSLRVHARTVGLFGTGGHHFAPKVHEAFNVQYLHTFRPAPRS